MPSAVPTHDGVPALSKWQRPAKTSQDLPWADIKVIDMSKYDQPGGKQHLADVLREAVSNSSSLDIMPRLCLTALQ